MNDPQLAAALRSRSPDALPELLDAYGDLLFSYCWRLLRNRENAQIAVRDALAVAIAQIGRLDCDEWLGLWLYSLARAECLRREAVPAADADEPVARPHQDDADSRIMAWNAVTRMPADEVEALELDSRHDVDLCLVLGLSAAEVETLLDRARRNLDRALGTEILIRRGHACPDRTAVLSGWTGTATPALQDRVLQHAATCTVCGPSLPRSVSPARVFGLLPAPALSSVARLEILEFFDDSSMAAYREFAVSRAAGATRSVFLTPSEPAAARARLPRAGRWRPHLSRIGAAAAASVAVTALFAVVGFRVTPPATTGRPPAAATSGPGSATAHPGGGADAIVPASVKRPAGASSATEPFQQSAASKTVSLAVAASEPGSSPPSRPGQVGQPGQPGRPETRASSSASSATPSPTGSLTVTPDSLNLGGGSTGQLTLTAEDGPVSWWADTQSPQVTTSSQQGTLKPGQSVTLVVTVDQGGSSSGSAFVFIDSAPVTGTAAAPSAARSAAPSASQAVEVTWMTYQPRHPRRSPPPSDPGRPSPSPSPSSSSASASTSASPSSS